jgi:D-sedoheptulose 7-phosphate isomerase
MNTGDLIHKELTEAAELLQKFLSNRDNIAAIEKAAKTIVASLKKGGIIISCGNGGSACDAMHFAEELSGKYRENREPIPAMAISDSGYITCTANDYGYGHVFSRYVKGFGNKGDILVAISTSGNSENVLKAAEAARQKQMKVIGLTGNNGGNLAELCDVHINVPHNGYSDRTQEIHIKIIHILIFLIEKQLNTDVG